MELAIELYIKQTYHPDLAASMFAAMELFERFDVNDYETDLLDLLMDADNRQQADLQDSFISKIRHNQDYILKQHYLELADDATLSERNIFIEALNTYQNLADYSNIIDILYSDDTDSEILIRIFASLTELSEDRVFTLLEKYDDLLLSTLKEFANTKESFKPSDLEEYDDTEKKLLANYNLFKKFITDKPALGFTLLSSGVLVNQPIDNYLSMFDEDMFYKVVTMNNLSGSMPPTKIALDLLSVILLSSDGYANPLETFRKISNKLIPHMGTLMAVDTVITRGISEFEAFKAKVKLDNQQG